MRTIKNRKLTTNFWLYEFMEGALMPKKAIEMNWNNIKDFDKYDVQRMAEDAQCIRNEVNKVFRDRNGGKEIGLLITSGWRCVEWELYKGRSGKGRHPIDAFDWQPTNVSAELNEEIVKWANDKWSPRVGGWNGGFAIAYPNIKEGLKGFIHHDRRGVVARWTY